MATCTVNHKFALFFVTVNQAMVHDLASIAYH